MNRPNPNESFPKPMIETHKISKFMVYDRMAREGSSAYSPKSHSAPHFEGHYVEGMEEWASHYCFNKKEDGTYEAELDEAWYEGSHYGGGTINVAIPPGMVRPLLRRIP